MSTAPAAPASAAPAPAAPAPAAPAPATPAPAPQTQTLAPSLGTHDAGTHAGTHAGAASSAGAHADPLVSAHPSVPVHCVRDTRCGGRTEPECVAVLALREARGAYQEAFRTAQEVREEARQAVEDAEDAMVEARDAIRSMEHYEEEVRRLRAEVHAAWDRAAVLASTSPLVFAEFDPPPPIIVLRPVPKPAPTAKRRASPYHR